MSKKVAVVYWSGTGNTEAMAQALVEGIQEADGTAELFRCDQFSADDIASFDAVAFGCPAMGAEELEADEFQPVWEDCSAKLSNTSVVLFGSYDWGTGEWMEIWKEDAEQADIPVVATVIANLEPDDDAIAELKAAAKELLA